MLLSFAFNFPLLLHSLVRKTTRADITCFHWSLCPVLVLPAPGNSLNCFPSAVVSAEQFRSSLSSLIQTVDADMVFLLQLWEALKWDLIWGGVNWWFLRSVTLMSFSCCNRLNSRSSSSLMGRFSQKAAVFFTVVDGFLQVQMELTKLK